MRKKNDFIIQPIEKKIAITEKEYFELLEYKFRYLELKEIVNISYKNQGIVVMEEK